MGCREEHFLSRGLGEAEHQGWSKVQRKQSVMENNRKSSQLPLLIPEHQRCPWVSTLIKGCRSLDKPQGIQHTNMIQVGTANPRVWGGQRRGSGAAVPGAWDEKATVNYPDSIIKGNIIYSLKGLKYYKSALTQPQENKNVFLAIGMKSVPCGRFIKNFLQSLPKSLANSRRGEEAIL